MELKIGKHAVFSQEEVRRKLFLCTCNFYKAKHTIVNSTRLMFRNVRILQNPVGIDKRTKKFLGVNQRYL